MYTYYSEYMNHDIHLGINLSSRKSMYVLTLKICVFLLLGLNFGTPSIIHRLVCKNAHHFKKCYTDRLLNSYELES